MYVCICIYISCIHTYIHTYILNALYATITRHYMYVHWSSHQYIYPQHTCIHTCMHTCMHVYMHLPSHQYTYPQHTYMHTCMCICLRHLIIIYVHCIHACIHTCMHMYTPPVYIVIDRNGLRHMSDGPYKRHEPVVAHYPLDSLYCVYILLLGMYVCMCVYMCVCMYVCIHVCMHVCGM